MATDRYYRNIRREDDRDLDYHDSMIIIIIAFSLLFCEE